MMSLMIAESARSHHELVEVVEWFQLTATGFEQVDDASIC